MAKVNIPVGEQGTTRVFSLSATPAQARALKASEQAQATILGVEDVNMDGIELFALDDLGDLGLVGYLREGSDAREEDLKRDGAKLSALEGWVMLVHSLAFAGNGASFLPDPALTLIGTYGQTPATRAEIALPSEAAKPYSGGSDPAIETQTNGRGTGTLVIAGLVAVCLVILWAVLR